MDNYIRLLDQRLRLGFKICSQWARVRWINNCVQYGTVLSPPSFYFVHCCKDLHIVCHRQIRNTIGQVRRIPAILQGRQSLTECSLRLLQVDQRRIISTLQLMREPRHSLNQHALSSRKINEKGILHLCLTPHNIATTNKTTSRMKAVNKRTNLPWRFFSMIMINRYHASW